jgi:Glycosyl transferase family 2/Glycosyl transferases group 1
VRVCIVSASGQNVFFAEMLEAFEQGLRAQGIEVERSVDCFPRLQRDLVSLFVPHEFMPLVDPLSHPTAAQMQRSVAICTEQPGTTWFDGSSAVAGRCGATIDINALGVEALSKIGIRARLVSLGYIPAWDHWGGDERERRIDVTFMGTVTERRELALARCGSILQGRRAALHLYETLVPHHADHEYFLSGTRKWEALAAAKTILNIHRGELAYMEWQRVLGAVLNGCVVVTEHSLGYAPFVPNEHFVSAAYDDLHLVVGALLDDPDRIAAIRRNAYAFVRDTMPMDASIDSLIEALQDADGNPVSAVRADPSSWIPRPRHAVTPKPAHMKRTGSQAEVMRGALKHLTTETKALRRELEAVRDSASVAPPDTETVVGPTLRRPRVSVVVTVYNYAEYVSAALASVARSDYRNYELLVIDDHSTDGSLDAVHRTLEQHPWVPGKIIAHGRNRGLAAARNAGVNAARGEYVFILDADNAVYPHALSRLTEALDSNPSKSFAYGIVEKFGHAGPAGLMSFLGWDPHRLRWGNYIDAMAMLRRQAVLDVGGYTTEPDLFGWEDFALWCALADAGHSGQLVAEILTRYRVGAFSMISVTNIDTAAAWTALMRRYDVVRPSALAAAW